MSAPEAVARTKSPLVAVAELVAFALLAVAVGALLIALGFGEAHGQERPKKKRTRELVVRGQAFPDTIAFVIDASGSMAHDRKYGVAIAEAMAIASQAGDEARVRFFAFSATCDPEPQGWILLPDAEALMLAKTWLEMHGAEGTTDMVGAMGLVLAMPVHPLGVVIISDEMPDTTPLTTTAEIHRMNKARESPAVIGCIGVSPPDLIDGEFPLGVLIAKPHGGAYIRNTVRKPAQ